MESSIIELTPAAHRHGNLNLSACGENFFPKDILGPPSRREGIHAQVMLKIDGFADPVLTDIPRDRQSHRPRWMFRERKWFKEFVRYHRLSPGDTVTICRIDEHNYFITPTARAQTTHLFERNLPPMLYAHHLAAQYLGRTSEDYRKQKGQYFTPPEVASFMAKLALARVSKSLRVLDPGAGAGMLAAAVCEHAATNPVTTRIHVDAYETDPAMVKVLYKSLLHTAQWAQEQGVKLTFDVFNSDFVLSATRLAAKPGFCPYDVIISNPPYLKIGACDPRAVALREVVYGQPNIYALFMAASALLAGATGSLVFITPRSFTSGHYFTAFRRFFFANLRPVRVHLFESRKDLFSDQSVLQENVIIHAVKDKSVSRVIISHSTNSDNLDCPRENSVPLQHALYSNGGDTILRLPLDETDDLVVQTVDNWPGALADYGLQISTGPVVPFRAEMFTRTEDNARPGEVVPLLWMCNVHPMKVTWPANGSGNRDSVKQFIMNDANSREKRLLVPNRTMVLLRRFSTKEEKRRLIAAPLLAGQFDFETLGIENHLNYIYSPHRELVEDEARGLAALLNSALLDRYFRICNGNTQVGAMELRVMPLPPIEQIRDLGRKLYRHCRTPSLDDIDKAVQHMVHHCKSKKLTLEEYQACHA